MVTKIASQNTGRGVPVPLNDQIIDADAISDILKIGVV